MTRGGRKDILSSYFRWLYSQGFPPGLPPGKSYTVICHYLHSIPFNDEVPNDDNRAVDGVELRKEFVSTLPSIGMQDYSAISSLGHATMLEMLIGLSRRADFLTQTGAANWVKMFFDNLGVSDYNDEAMASEDPEKVIKILVRMNERRYTRTGKGGLFPLRRAGEDQRLVELWYQMAAYLKENHMY